MPTAYELGESWYDININENWDNLWQFYQDAFGATDVEGDYPEMGPQAFYFSYMPTPFDASEVYNAEQSADIQKNILQSQFLEGNVRDIQKLAGLSGLATSGVGAHTDLYSDLESSYTDIDLSQEEIFHDLYTEWGENWIEELGMIGEMGAFDAGTYEDIDWEINYQGDDMYYATCVSQTQQQNIDAGFGAESYNMAINACNSLFEFSSDDLIDLGDG